jgi:hypothetical protein
MLSLCACSTAPQEPAIATLTSTHDVPMVANVGSASVPQFVTGYVHSLAVSKFRIGDAPSLELNTSAIQRWRGSLGAFAVFPNGFAQGVLDATTTRGPYILDTDTHNMMVRNYFLNAGVPSDQVASALTSYVSGGGGAMGPSNSSASPLQRLITTISRTINGIPVMDSWAAASMRLTGDVDWESVFWPPVSKAVAEAATALATSLADSSTHAKFIAALPDVVREERGVVIHHTRLESSSAAPTAYVSFDVFLGSDLTRGERHFDANGVEFKLPQEVATNPATQR